MALEMSNDCKYFVQHAWKQDLCANCFESREDHWKKLRQLNIFVPKFTANVRSILGPHENSKKQRKNVVFRTSLTEIIGYGGDDDIYESFKYNSNDSNENSIRPDNNDDDDDHDHDDNNDNINNDDDYLKMTEETRSIEDNISSSNEEDRILSNLTRSNTNFNRTAANFIESTVPSQFSGDTKKIIPKCFDNLILGNIQKDSEGKKKTLFISVTPFGSNTNSDVISAERSADRPPINDRKKPIIPLSTSEILDIESNDIPLIPNTQLPKLNDTLIDQCQEENLLTVTMNLNYNEHIKNDLTQNKLENDGINIENILPIESPLSASVSSISSNVEHSEINSKGDYQIESVDIAINYESSLSEIQEEYEINDIKLNDEIMSVDVLTNFSSIDSTKINAPAKSSTIPPKPRNSFLHGGQHIDDTRNLPLKLDKQNEFADSSFLANQPENNLADIIIQKDIGTKSPEKSSDDVSSSIFARKPASNMKSDCPVVREKEKRERATSCSPKFRNIDENLFTCNYRNETPENMSKRCVTRSLSRHSSSSYSAVLSNTNVVDDEAKKKNKTRFSLKRLLRLGSSKRDLNITTEDTFSESIKNISPVSQFKNKPEIIHPLELDGATVEILYHDKLIKMTDEVTNIRSSSNRAIMRAPPPPPPNNMYLSSQTELHERSSNKSTEHSLHDEQEGMKMSTHDTDREHPSCHSITPTSISSVHSMSADTIHTGIRNFGKFRPIQCN